LPRVPQASDLKRDRAGQSLRVRTEQDRRAHVPVHVVWEITLACNLKCGHCGSRAGKRRANELSTSECLDVVRQLAAAGTREITLIGGEAYLRRDWLQIAAEIARLGIHCGLQTGARGLTRERIVAAHAAGVRAIGVSVDGLRDLHDEIRGVPGSHDQAIQAIRDIRDVGIEPGVNTQINTLSMPQLTKIFDEITAAGAKYWQVQLTVAMGNAVDNSAMLLQPHQIIDVVDCLARLYHRGRDIGFRVLPGNSIGYFGRHEPHWRSLTTEITHWNGCTAGETTLASRLTVPSRAVRRCPSRTMRAANPAPSRSTMRCAISRRAPSAATATAAAASAVRATIGIRAAAAAPGYRMCWKAGAATIPTATIARRPWPGGACAKPSPRSRKLRTTRLRPVVLRSGWNEWMERGCRARSVSTTRFANAAG